jgi:septal ring factor EnvC (AmiA/AmiB activator)
MFRFIGKTMLFGTLGVAALGCLYGKDQLVRWFEQGKATIEHKINEFQGMSAELDKIEGRVQSLEDEVRRLKEQSIREEVEVEHLQRETSERAASLERLHKNLEKAQALLASGADRFVIGGTGYARAEVERDVSEKLDLYRVQKDTLAQLEQTLGTHRSALAIARENVARGEALRQELKGRVRLLQAKLEKHRAREVYAEAVACDFDAREFNTEIGEVRSLFAKFETRLEVKGRMLDERLKLAAGSRVGGIDYESPERPAEKDVASRLSKFLCDENAAPAPVAVVTER